MPERRLTAWVIILSVFALLICFLLAPSVNAVAATLASGFVVSAVFYFMVVWLPERRRRHLIHKNFQEHFRRFKLNCIQLFLMSSNSQQYHPHEMLLDQAEFRRYFKISVLPDQDRWHMVLNSMQSNSYILRELLHELEVLRGEIHFVLNNIDIHDEDAFDFLKRLGHSILRLRDIQPEYDDVEYIGDFLWSIFTGWSVIDGYREQDLFSQMMERVQ